MKQVSLSNCHFNPETVQLGGPARDIFKHLVGSQHPSPNVKTFCKFEPQIWLEIITSRDAKSACFKGSRTSCREIIFGIFWPNFGQKRSHHVMDASCRFGSLKIANVLFRFFRVLGKHQVFERHRPKCSQMLCFVLSSEKN